VVAKELSRWAKETIADEQTLTAAPSEKSMAVLYDRNQTGKAAFRSLKKGMTVMLITDLSKLKTSGNDKTIAIENLVGV
jgi:TolB-like protein